MVKTLLAAKAAEEKCLPIICRRMSRPSDLDSHPTYGIHNRRLRTYSGSRDGGTGFTNGLAAAPELEDLRHDTETNLRRCDGAELQSGRTLDALQ
jgi:hypothetical protein